MTIIAPGVGAQRAVLSGAPAESARRDQATIVLAFAAEGDRWRPRVRHDIHGRQFERMASAEDHEVWLICWDVGQMTLLHDHGPSAGAFVVVEGMLLEDHGRPGSGRLAQRRVLRGRARSFGPSYVHNLANPGPGPATSIHAYSPRLTTMTYYAMLPGGVVPVRALPVDSPEPTAP